ncbi:hypothetical protein FHR24_000387 [Wenyingzhuangia heitensis]|uniref:Uncharacterized protein n=1 Tax=Wenyingzhuangia heitensis TaxID=1487859 RepID=A0ABX0U511_9FLAO|nr:hypothetical protein [Wenyingzhuangia heitensis]NIJ43948.1 hypothetical protein [Wenyingzhuangia heitensis]
MNKLIAILLTLSLFSCQKICSVASILCKGNVEKQDPIDFTQVDQFPQFKDCEALLSFEENKICFEKTMYKKINQRVQNLHFKTDKNIIDTVFIHFSINQKGQFIFNRIKAKDSLLLVFPKLSINIQEIIHELPSIAPAQKRGIPITSTYTLPLVIQSH